MKSAVMHPAPPTLAGAAVGHTDAGDPVGALEVVTTARIAGWAADRRAFGRRIEVEVRIGEEVIARVTADRQRGDLARAGLGDGSHGFEWRPSEPLPVERLAQVEAFALLRADGGQTIPLPKRRPDGTFPATARTASPPGWISELAALCQQIERHARRLDALAAGSTKASMVAANDDTVRIQQLLAGLSVRLESLDGLQLRLDEMAAQLERLADTKPGSGKAGLGLACAVALTAVIAAGSLTVGSWSYFG
jgi:hypothetical protein